MIQVIQANATSSEQSFPESIQRLISNIKNQSAMVPTIARECILDARISPEDLMGWADFDHPITDSYGRKLIYHGGSFEIMVLSWAPGDYTTIHDHGASQWGAVQCFGEAEDYMYTLTDGVLQTQKRLEFSSAQVKAVAEDMIHQMGNPGKFAFLSLHVYGGENPNDSITSNSRIFDLFEGSIQRTDGAALFCLPEAEIKERHYGLQADANTTLRHHEKMRDRICRILAVQDNPLLRSKLAVLDKQMSQLK
ncbi:MULTISPECIES: cysteine dioxygenase family protein [Moorena]|uniref:Cysteine dioxygenase n=1 Tax=Moorena bouillonii PNG TaxID=568701 RepID=A0A1U7NBW0_9CYAN|nr:MULTISPECIES: cysteine dioxygenase family protein [Moorena]NEO24655.1 cysteine dioxygenase [Moorena sp. SIO4A5]OLT63440.1 cysteine dioxygenase [Moorena bouillonii PNG]